MKKLAVFLLAGLVGACGTTTDPGTGDDGPDGGDDELGPMTNGVSTLSGSAEAGYADGKRGIARFANPVGAAYRDGKVYVADFDNGKIRVVDATDGTTTTLIAAQGFSRPFALAFAPDGTLFVTTDRSPNENTQTLTSGTIWRVDVGAKTATPIAIGIGRPRGIAVLASGKLVVADYQNHAVSTVDAVTGKVTPLAGAWGAPGMADAPGAAAHFNQPYGVAVKGDKVLVADYGNHRIREVSLDGNVRTLAGAGAAGSNDGAMGTAQFRNPQGLAVTANGDIYVADVENYRIRKITGSVETIALDGTPGHVDDDNLLAGEAYGMEGIAVASDGSMLFLADGGRGENVPHNFVRSIKLR